MQSFVGKLPEFPHPIASNISNRMMVALGVLTAAMAAAAVVIGDKAIYQAMFGSHL